MSPFALLATILCLAAPNPVLPHVADAGVFRYAGQYYIMGVGTSGAVHVSDDLVHWSAPTHVFSMDNAWATGPAAKDREIHACDIVLHNGAFHLYWSVNYHDLRQIGHAVADAPLGPYREPVQDAPFDGRIDPQCFIDDDGKLYFYTVKFNAGNVIWGQPMAAPGQLSGEPKQLLSPQLKGWEAQDVLDGHGMFLINEGPFVAKHHGRYYLIYNANHTGGEYGNYALGVAESDTPLGFNNATKYPFPVLRSNRDQTHEGSTRDPASTEVKNCGQPNLVRGPNGIEWWLVYFADSPQRSQHIDRAHFFGPELYIEGPSLAGDPGHWPAPALPSFADRFQDKSATASRWTFEGNWDCADDTLRLDATGGTVNATASATVSSNFVIETVLQHDPSAAGRLGLRITSSDTGATLHTGLDREQGTWYWHFLEDGREQSQTQDLPKNFNWHGPHKVRLERNAGRYTTQLDGLTHHPFEPKGNPSTSLAIALFAENCTARFHHLQFTRGWDESGRGIRGWRNAQGVPQESSEEGLTVNAGEQLFKGEPLLQYECGIQLLPAKNSVLWPIHADVDNYLQVNTNADFTVLRVSGKSGGTPLPEQEFPVPARLHRAHPAERTGYHLRCVKLRDKVILYADGAQVAQIDGAWPPARMGLGSETAATTYTALTRYELP